MIHPVIPALGLRLEDCKLETSVRDFVVPSFRCGTGDTACLRSWASSAQPMSPGTCSAPKEVQGIAWGLHSQRLPGCVSGCSGASSRSSHPGLKLERSGKQASASNERFSSWFPRALQERRELGGKGVLERCLGQESTSYISVRTCIQVPEPT